MTTGDAEPVFVDANILVYAGVLGSPFHHVAARTMQELLTDGVEVWISRQFIREYLATLTRPQTFASPQPVATLISDVRYFERHFRVAEDGPPVTQRLLALMASISVGGKRVHDANVVATMQVHGVRRLLTHNTSDFARFAALITVVPLVSPPSP